MPRTPLSRKYKQSWISSFLSFIEKAAKHATASDKDLCADMAILYCTSSDDGDVQRPGLGHFMNAITNSGV